MQHILSIINEPYLIVGIVMVVSLCVMRYFISLKMKKNIYLCVEFFIRNCHTQKTYLPFHKGYLEYASLYRKLKRKQHFFYYPLWNKRILCRFLTWYEEVDAFIIRMNQFMGTDHYFTHSEYLSCIDHFCFSEITLPYVKEKGFIECIQKEVPEAFNSKEEYFDKVEIDFSDVVKTHNDCFVEEELKRNKQFFDTVLPYPLDQQQRESIVKLEDNCLVISSAGSGKTSTTVGKIKYLIERRSINPAKILPLTYTVKAAQELTERLHHENEGLTCHTFHSLARKIIAQTTQNMPALCDAGLMLQCFYYLIVNRQGFKEAINSFLTERSSLTKNLHDYVSPLEYHTDRALYGIQAPFKDMDGRIIFTRSEEEKKICTFLSMNGIAFRYEHPYFQKTSTEFRRQYYPDFTIYFQKNGKNHFVILEHFGIDAKGNVPRWFAVGHERGKTTGSFSTTLDPYKAANQEYNEGIKWKRSINKHYNVGLLETTSAMFHDNTWQQKLTYQLNQYGIQLNPLSEDEKIERLVKRDKVMEGSILQLITTFIALIKSNRKTPKNILDTIKKENKDRLDFIERSRFMIEEILEPIFDEYQKTLSERKQVDYTDLILEATEICNKGLYKNDYDMIIVDEFQDISVDRYQFIQALRKKSPLTKLYVVGDDWQSIFRFSGSDLSLFSSFDDYFGYTERCKIEKTYRFGKPLVEKSTSFIMKNELQVSKNVVSNNSAKKTDLSLLVYSDNSDNTQFDKLKEIIKAIPSNESVMLIGRYHSDASFIPISNVRNRSEKGNVISVEIDGRELSFNTVHSAKGLEADHVILVNCSQDGKGFPSKIADDPILGYVLSSPESFPFAEERRLFYVALTRAKKHAYVMFKETCPSQFVTELVHDSGTDKTMECPWCGKSFLRVVANGVNNEKTAWRLYRCSNYVAGCGYKWLVRYPIGHEDSIPQQFDIVKRYSEEYGSVIAEAQASGFPIPQPSVSDQHPIQFPPPPIPSSISDEDDDLPF